MRIVLGIHVALGFTGLAAFWVPILTRKGGKTHKLFGRIYKYCAYIVLGTAGIAVVLRATQFLMAGETPLTRPAQFGFMLFLGYLALVTIVVVRHGVGVLEHKGNPYEMATWQNRTLAILAIVASVLVIGYAAILSPPNKILLYALSPIGLATGSGILRYISRPAVSQRAWLYEHLGSMIGGGIAFHTAFAVFGITRVIDIGFEGWIAVIPWIAPAAIGIPATVIWTRYYRRKFGELT